MLDSRRIKAAVSLVALLLTFQPRAMADEGLTVRSDLVGPRDIFFSDYFLFSAQADVMTMAAGEHVALESLLDTRKDALEAAQQLQALTGVELPVREEK